MAVDTTTRAIAATALAIAIAAVGVALFSWEISANLYAETDAARQKTVELDARLRDADEVIRQAARELLAQEDVRLGIDHATAGAPDLATHVVSLEQQIETIASALSDLRLQVGAPQAPVPPADRESYLRLERSVADLQTNFAAFRTTLADRGSDIENLIRTLETALAVQPADD